MYNNFPIMATDYITVTTQAIGDMVRVEIRDLDDRLLLSYVVETDVVHQSPPIRLAPTKDS